MKPPICEICGRDFRASISEGGLVHFKLTEANIQYNKCFEQSGFSGHPAGAYWFCKKHYKKAKNYQGLTFAEASEKIQEKQKNKKIGTKPPIRTNFHRN